MGYSRDRVRTQSDLTPVFDEILKHRGWGQCLGIEEVTEDNETIFTATIRNCPLCFEGKARRQACDIMKGIVSGWIEAYLSKRAIGAIETR